MIAIAPPEIHARSKGTLQIRTTVDYDGSQGYPVYLTATATNQGEVVPWITAPAFEITGTPAPVGAVTLELSYRARDPAAPLRLSSDGIVLQLAAANAPPFTQTRTDYIRNWSRDVAYFRPADLEGLPFRGAALSTGALRAAYDGDEQGGLVLARPRGRALLGLVVQVGAVFQVLRWFDYSALLDARGAYPARPGYVVAPGGYIDLAQGREVADAASADAVWVPESGTNPPMRLRPLNGTTATTLRTPVTLPLAVTRVFAQGNPRDGTIRDWNEIRDIFDNCNEEPYRADLCVDNIWAPAGIEFRIIVRREIRIADNWAHQLPATVLREFSRAHNLPRLLNVYFLRAVEGARAWGAADRNPGQNGQQGALWVGDRCFEAPTSECWAEDIVTIAHEAGHFLNLAHRCDNTGAHPPCRPGDEQYLMYGDGTSAASRVLTDEEIFRARQRAWYYRP
jgi:hypothetical protein